MESWLDKISPHVRKRSANDGGLPNVYHAHHVNNWVEPMRIIYDHELVLFGGGTFSVEIDSTVYECPPNTFLIIPPGVPHASALAGAAGDRHWVHFNWIAGPEMIGRRFTFLPSKVYYDRIQPAPHFVPQRILHGPIPEPEAVFDLFVRLENRWNFGHAHEKETCRALLLEILLGLLIDRRKIATRERSPDVMLVRRAYDLLSKLAIEPMNRMPSIRTSLQGMGCSYEHVAHLFKEVFGISPIRFVNAQRLERARLLLRDSDLSVAEIARRTGFTDPCYFARLFRKHTGVSASEYARRGAPPNGVQDLH